MCFSNPKGLLFQQYQFSHVFPNYTGVSKKCPGRGRNVTSAKQCCCVMPYGRMRVPVAERYVVANCNALFILLYMVHFWHGLHRMRQAQCNSTSSVCLSICLSHSPAAAARGGFAAVGTAGGWYGSIAARCVCSRRGCLSIHIHSSTAVSNKCEQCHVYSHSRKLNTDLLISETAITSTQRGPTIVWRCQDKSCCCCYGDVRTGTTSCRGTCSWAGERTLRTPRPPYASELSVLPTHPVAHHAPALPAAVQPTNISFRIMFHMDSIKVTFVIKLLQ